VDHIHGDFHGAATSGAIPRWGSPPASTVELRCRSHVDGEGSGARSPVNPGAGRAGVRDQSAQDETTLENAAISREQFAKSIELSKASATTTWCPGKVHGAEYRLGGRFWASAGSDTNEEDDEDDAEGDLFTTPEFVRVAKQAEFLSAEIAQAGNEAEEEGPLAQKLVQALVDTWSRAFAPTAMFPA
jgi:hypothetical protein